MGTEEPGITERERARRIVAQAKGRTAGSGSITGLRGAQLVIESITLQRLADHGVPELLVLPYDTDSLRALVQELAQIEVD